MNTACWKTKNRGKVSSLARDVNDEQVTGLRIETALDEILQQILYDLRVLARALGEPEQLFPTLAVHAHGRQDVVPADHDAIEVNRQQFDPVQASLHQCFQGFFARLDELARDATLLDSHGAGHDRQDTGIFTCGDPGDQDVAKTPPRACRHRADAHTRVWRSRLARLEAVGV